MPRPVRIAVLADVHGNDVALEAVIADVEDRGGVDEYWVLGDAAAIGHAPVAVLDWLRGRDDVRCISGNTDRYVCTGDRPPPTVEDVETDPSLLPTLLSVHGSFSWTQGAVTAAGHLDWLASLPAELRCELPDGTRALCMHGSPVGGDFEGIWPDMGEDEIGPLVAGCDAELVCVGHTHCPLDVAVYGCRVVNPGSVSNPVGRDMRAGYAVVEAGEDGYRVEFRRVEYDRERVIRVLEEMGHPARGFIVEHLRGRCVVEGLEGAVAASTQDKSS
ncbi:MAG: metallophosphoesterase family protein [bacterium]|nr:metallophosphoesterase family protein [bacterium]